jgi:hypothetical protein
MIAAGAVTTVQTCAQVPATVAAAQPGDILVVAQPGEITGLTFNGVGLQLVGGSGWNVHGNTVTNITSAVNNAGNQGTWLYVNGVSNSHFDHNTLTNVAGFGIVAYPGNSCTFDFNTFTNVYEPLHAMGGSPASPIQGFDCSFNTITQASRHGIELQLNVNNLTCNNNYMADWLNPPGQIWQGLASHMGISAACGQKGPPWVGGGNGMTIDGNTILLNGLPGQNLAANPVMQSCIELMGQNITVENNYLSGGFGLLNGAIGKVTTANNTIVAYQGVANGDSTPWPVMPITLTSTDQVYQPGAANVPAAPSIVATVGSAASVQTPAQPTAAPPAVPAAATTAPAASTPSITHRITIYSDGSVQEN